jgi:hypothetical protein
MTTRNETKDPRGRKTTLTDEISGLIINSVRETLSINFAAESHGIPRSTVTTWMAMGNEDLSNGVDSIFVLFTQGIKRARAEYIQDSVRMLKTMPKNWQATAWILERCCAEDFGKDAELYKQLLDDYKMLMQSLVDQNKGVTHGS